MSKDIKTFQLDELYPSAEGSSRLLIGSSRDAYSASKIAAAVEDADAHVLNLNLIMDESGTYDMLVDLRINRLNGESVARSLERYGFEVIDFAVAENPDESVLRRRVEELMRYINV